jgi:exonuclease III
MSVNDGPVLCLTARPRVRTNTKSKERNVESAVKEQRAAEVQNEHGPYARLLAQGWTDALREVHPGEAIYTYWDYFRNASARNAGLRMDHILLSPKMAPRLVGAGVSRDAYHRDDATGRRGDDSGRRTE